MIQSNETDIMDSIEGDFVPSDILADYICDYVDQTMNQELLDVFEQYVAAQKELSAFVNDATLGKKALQMLRDTNSELDDQS